MKNQYTQRAIELTKEIRDLNTKLFKENDESKREAIKYAIFRSGIDLANEVFSEINYYNEQK